MPGGRLVTAAAYNQGMPFPPDQYTAQSTQDRAHPPYPFMSGRALADAAQALAAEFGDDAPLAATMRARESRARDNAVSFCHWREVERLFDWLDQPQDRATAH